VGQRSLKVIENGTIWKLRYGFLFAFYSNYGISEIFSVRELYDLQIWVWGPSRSLKMTRFDRPCMIFYWSTIVTIALSCTVSKLFDVEYYRDLEIRLRRHSRSYKLVPFESLGAVSYSNYGRIYSRLWDTQCQRMAWPWKPDQGSFKVI